MATDYANGVVKSYADNVVAPRQAGLSRSVSSKPDPELSDTSDENRDWRGLANDEIGVDISQFMTQDKRMLNTRITAAYARMYLRNREVFKWSGMAAYASNLVGIAIRWSSVARHVETQTSLGPAGFGAPSAAEYAEAFSRGNSILFKDQYWQHLAYHYAGIAELERLYAQESGVSARALQAWQLIDRGRKQLDQAKLTFDAAIVQGGISDIWSGNTKLLKLEQEEILQATVYDPDREAFSNFSALPEWAIVSPIPGDDITFRKFVPDGDLGDFSSRWRWIEGSMLPKWRQHSESDPVQVNREMIDFAKGSELPIPVGTPPTELQPYVDPR